jgi:hypothetical protein
MPCNNATSGFLERAICQGKILGLFAGSLTLWGGDAGSTVEFRPRQALEKPLPAITDAPFLTADQVEDALVRDDELVLGVTLNEHARAYPINQLTGPRREIINDSLGGERFAATW